MQFEVSMNCIRDASDRCGNSTMTITSLNVYDGLMLIQ